MILFHGSDHEFEWPEYGAMFENTQDQKDHPKGLWVTSDPVKAATYGRCVYRIEAYGGLYLTGHEADFQQPRHKLLQNFPPIMLMNYHGYQSGLIVDLDAIEMFHLFSVEPLKTAA